MLDARNIVIKLVEQLGSATLWAGGKLGEEVKRRFGVDVPEKIDGVLQELLWSFQSGAMIWLDLDGAGDRWGWLVIGALSGAGLNFAFIDYYQEMARMHFAVRGASLLLCDRPGDSVPTAARWPTEGG